MIECINIVKKYGELEIFRNFNYSFDIKGLYFLYGRSGSGKTTLLNMLCGLTDYEKGSIRYENIGYSFNKKVDNEIAMNYVAYISQNTYFIDYLTIYENLKLCANNETDIKEILKKFNLEYLSDCYPFTLSSGERQRIAIIQSLLKGKRILLLDEPTASLDRSNKIAIFEILSKLKKNVLIIISSHDEEIIKYSDHVIEFDMLNKYSKKFEINNNIKNVKNQLIIEEKKKQNLFFYMKKKHKRSKIEKKSNIPLLIVFVLTIMICFICDTPINKLLTNIDKTYKINQFMFRCGAKENDKCAKILKSDLVKEVVFDYGFNLPLPLKDETAVIQIDYNATAVTLPFQKEYFRLSNKLLYGKYFEKENDILISYEYASLLSNGSDFKNLLGQKITEKMYEGNFEFEIVGIFDKFTDKDLLYFQGSSLFKESITNNFFINSKYSSKYLNIYNSEKIDNQKTYCIYFKNFSDMDKVYRSFTNTPETFISTYESLFINIAVYFQTTALVLYPIAIISLILALLFYFQATIIKLEYSKYNYCVYNYYGYSIKDIIHSFTIVTVIQVVKLLLYSLIVATFLGILINYLNDIFTFFSFTIFSFNFNLVFYLSMTLIFISFIISFSLSKRIKKMGWYNLLQESRDLI